MHRRLAPALLTAVALVSLTGCVKLDADIEVHTDETVSGTMTVGMSKQLMEMMEGFGESFGESMGGDETGDETGDDSSATLDEDFFEPDEVPEGATVEPYEDDKFIGQTMTFSDITLDELSASTSDDGEEEMWTLTREGDTFIFDGNADFAEEGDTAQAEEMGFEEMFDDADLEISVTFPGRVTESNGEVDGNTVTWRPVFGETLDMHAEAKATSSFPVWPVVGAVAGVLLLGGLVLLALRQRRSRAADGHAGQEAAPAPGDDVVI